MCVYKCLAKHGNSVHLHLHKEDYQCVTCNKWFGSEGTSEALQSTHEVILVATFGLCNHLNDSNMARKGNKTNLLVTPP